MFSNLHRVKGYLVTFVFVVIYNNALEKIEKQFLNANRRMHEKYEQGRGWAKGDIFVLTKTKISDDTQSGLHLEKVRKLALLVKWRCFK